MRIIVTAGASGIGRAMAEEFLSQGAQVAICDIDEAALADFSTAHPEAIAVNASVADQQQVEAFFDQVETAFGGLDVVCANAGTGGPAGAIEEIMFEDWRACLAVNLDGAFLTARCAAKIMKAQGNGLLLFTSSTAGIMGYPYRSPYAAAKWAVVGLTKTLAMELGPQGIRVNAVCPGAVEGDRMDRVIANEANTRGITEEEVRQRYVTGVSMKTWVKAEDIAAMATFLASPAGAKISGQVISVDGHTESLSP
jgi:NAD(P)-dependent dehydrogenase (short-subunit alcohol dehydrogenase family)